MYVYAVSRNPSPDSVTPLTGEACVPLMFTNTLNARNKISHVILKIWRNGLRFERYNHSKPHKYDRSNKNNEIAVLVLHAAY